ncbi:MAG: ORF6N domain-containing protein [Acidobacteriota bacterium]
MAQATIAKNAVPNNAVPLAAESMQAVIYRGQPVLSTATLADFYQTTPDRIRGNFNYQREKFSEGVHFFQLKGEELQRFKNDVRNSTAVKNVSHTKALTLYTARGAARHAKALNTNVAWEVFEKLEDSYFSRREPVPQPAPSRRSTAKERNKLAALMDTYIGAMGVNPSPEAYKAAWRKIHSFFGVHRIEDLAADQVNIAERFLQELIESAKAKGEPKALPKGKTLHPSSMILTSPEAGEFDRAKERFTRECYAIFEDAQHRLKNIGSEGPNAKAVQEMVRQELYAFQAQYDATMFTAHSFAQAVFRIDRLAKIASVL